MSTVTKAGILYTGDMLFSAEQTPT